LFLSFHLWAIKNVCFFGKEEGDYCLFAKLVDLFGAIMLFFVFFPAHKGSRPSGFFGTKRIVPIIKGFFRQGKLPNISCPIGDIGNFWYL
jgi:hypothetical protein